MPTWQGTLYLASVIDCYSRRVVGWSMRDQMPAGLVVDALEMAISRRRPAGGKHCGPDPDGPESPSSSYAPL